MHYIERKEEKIYIYNMLKADDWSDVHVLCARRRHANCLKTDRMVIQHYMFFLAKYSTKVNFVSDIYYCSIFMIRMTTRINI